MAMRMGGVVIIFAFSQIIRLRKIRHQIGKKVPYPQAMLGRETL